MQQFFVTADQVQENQIYIEGTDVNHMKNVLRMRPGEKLGISDGNNHHYICQVEKYEDAQAVLTILEEESVDTELPSKIYLFQGLAKGGQDGTDRAESSRTWCI